MLPFSVAFAIYRMTGTADVPSTSRTAAAPVEESVAAPASGPGPLLSPSSDSADTTEPALEEPSAPTSPPPAEPVEPAPVGQVAEPPEAWAEMLAFLDRPQQARQYARASATATPGVVRRYHRGAYGSGPQRRVWCSVLLRGKGAAS